MYQVFPLLLAEIACPIPTTLAKGIRYGLWGSGNCCDSCCNFLLYFQLFYRRKGRDEVGGAGVACLGATKVKRKCGSKQKKKTGSKLLLLMPTLS